MSEFINTTVAAQLKKARAEKGWSLDTTSQHCGVSKAMLGQIERGESSPTIARLWKIATGFELPLSDFLGQEPDQEPVNKGLIEGEVISIDTVFEFDPNTGIEMFKLIFAVDHEQYSEPHQLGVVEHIVVISGSMEYLYEGQWKPLNVGEKAKFLADQPHAYRNIGDGPLEFFNIIHYPRT